MVVVFIVGFLVFFFVLLFIKVWSVSKVERFYEGKVCGFGGVRISGCGRFFCFFRIFVFFIFFLLFWFLWFVFFRRCFFSFLDFDLVFVVFLLGFGVIFSIGCFAFRVFCVLGRVCSILSVVRSGE